MVHVNDIIKQRHYYLQPQHATIHEYNRNNFSTLLCLPDEIWHLIFAHFWSHSKTWSALQQSSYLIRTYCKQYEFASVLIPITTYLLTKKQKEAIIKHKIIGIVVQAPITSEMEWQYLLLNYPLVSRQVIVFGDGSVPQLQQAAHVKYVIRSVKTLEV